MTHATLESLIVLGALFGGMIVGGGLVLLGVRVASRSTSDPELDAPAPEIGPLERAARDRGESAVSVALARSSDCMNAFNREAFAPRKWDA